MKTLLKIALAVFGTLAVLIICFVIFLAYAAKQPMVKDNYFEDVLTSQPLEQRYTAEGEFAVSSKIFESENEKIGHHIVWYPAEMENGNNKATYPLVVMTNGTGVKSSKYQPIFKHLASWGFIVVGNEDESSFDGISSAASLDLMLNLNGDDTSIFYEKIDIQNIGIAGHSQGGVGAINAVTAQENGTYHKTIYTASTPHLALAEALKWEYDVSKIQIPYFMVAGALQVDAGDGIEGSSNVGIAPLFSLQENYAAISEQVEKIMARRVNTDHGDMLPYADGYMTAWFMYQLKGDSDAAKVFVGDDAEILSNANWQDVQKNR